MSNKAPKKKSGSFGRSLFGRLFGGKRELSIFEEEQMQSPFRTVIRNFRSNKVAMFGTIVFLIIFLSCFILPIFFPLDVTYTDSSQQNIAPGFSMLSVPDELKNGNAVDIAGGGTFGIGADKNGEVYLWGQMDDRLKEIPENMGKIVSVSAGLNHVLALDEDGQVYTWGYNSVGQLGLGDKINRNIPTATGKSASIIGAGYNHSFYVDAESTYGFGKNNTGQLGIENQNSVLIPTLIPELKNIVQIDGGFDFSIARDLNNNIWVLGSNEKGQLGIY